MNKKTEKTVLYPVVVPKEMFCYVKDRISCDNFDYSANDCYCDLKMQPVRITDKTVQKPEACLKLKSAGK